MPTYQYACTACDHQLEAVQSFSDDPLTVCPECEGKLRKVFSAVGVVFKGSGFYRTDSRAGNGSNGSSGSDGASDGNGAKSNGASGAKSEKSGGGKSESSSSSSSNGSSSSTSASKAAATT